MQVIIKDNGMQNHKLDGTSIQWLRFHQLEKMWHDICAEKESLSRYVDRKKKSKNLVSVNMNITLSFMQKEDMHYLLCAGYSSKIFMYLFISTSQLYQVSIIIIIFSYIREN